MMMRATLTIALVCALAAPGLVETATAAPTSKAKKRSTKRHAKKRARTTRRKRRRARRRRRKRDPFTAAPQVLDITGKSSSGALTAGQVAKVMRRAAQKLAPCLVLERRRDPNVRKAFVEFVVTGSGRVLATRVNGKRKTLLTKCMHRKLRPVRFPRSKRPRQVASFTMRVTQ